MIGERLRAVELPDEAGARERAARVVAAAFAERESPARSLPSPRLAPALAAVAAALVALLAFTTPGEAVRRWVSDVIVPDHHARPARNALERMPAGGSQLVRSGAGVWVVRADGAKRLLGPYDDATWSPQARFVAVTRPSGLLAVEPSGRVHWSLARAGARRPRWAPSGFRVAYVWRGRVRVVAGDGTGDRDLRRGAIAEWRPGAGNVLAIARADGRVRVEDVDSGRLVWRAATAAGPRQLSWSADGRLLLVTSGGRTHVLPFDSPAAERIGPAGEAVFAPRGRRVALLRRRAGVSQLVLTDARGRGERLLFAGGGRLEGVTWSPDGRWLLAAWPTSDQFVYVSTTGAPQVRVISHVAREFDPRKGRGAPTPAGWR